MEQADEARGCGPSHLLHAQSVTLHPQRVAAVSSSVSCGVHDSRAAHGRCARCCSHLCTMGQHAHTPNKVLVGHAPLCLNHVLSNHLHALHAPLCCDNVYNVRRPTYDGAGAFVTRRHTRGAYAARGTRWISRQSDRAAVREGKQLPAVVLMRGRGRRCMWSVDAASGLSARVLEAKTVQEMDGQGGVRGVVWGVDGTWWSLYT